MPCGKGMCGDFMKLKLKINMLIKKRGVYNGKPGRSGGHGQAASTGRLGRNKKGIRGMVSPSAWVNKKEISLRHEIASYYNDIPGLFFGELI